MIFILLAARFGVAQENIVVLESATTQHSVENHPGSEYSWEIFTGFNPDIEADISAYSLIQSSNENAVNVQWKVAGLYFLKVTETDSNGCGNVKVQVVNVISNNRSIAFSNLASKSCYSEGQNGFAIELLIYGNNGAQLDEEYFPLSLNFTLNGVEHTQQIEFSSHELKVEDQQLLISPTSTNKLDVELLRVNDVSGVELPIVASSGKHTRTIYENVVIEFASGFMLIEQGVIHAHPINLISGNSNNATYSWEVLPAGKGTSTDISAIDGSIATINWDGNVGIYTVQAVMEDGNNCRSNIITQRVEITEPALVDIGFDENYPDVDVCSGINDVQRQFRIYSKGKYSIESAQITIKNPDGNYVDLNGELLAEQQNPELVINNSEEDSHISFFVSLNWENSGVEPVQFEIELIHVVEISGNTITSSDVEKRFLTILPLPAFEFVDFSSNIALNTEQYFETDNSSYQYSWWFTNEDGTRNDFSSTSSQTELRLWDEEGTYQLFVQATDQNGCLSEIISQEFVVKAPDDELKVDAGDDITIGSCDVYQLQAAVFGSGEVTYLWEPGNNLDDPTTASPVFTPEETTTFIVTVSDLDGNTAKDTLTITVSDLLVEAGEDLVIEEDETAILDASASIGEDLQYSWSSENGIIQSGNNTANPIISSAGVYRVVVEDLYGCIATDSVVVSDLSFAPIANDDRDTTSYQSSLNIPVLDNDDGQKSTIEPSSLRITLQPMHGSTYIDYNDFTITYNPDAGYIGNDVFEYEVCNEYNQCDNARVYVVISPVDFFIPEAFTPNGDNINDYFEIKGIEIYEGNSLTIVNRWGKKVYEARNYGISTTPQFWDGKSNQGSGTEDLPTGTYFYVLDLGNGKKPIAGSVYIDR